MCNLIFTDPSTNRPTLSPSTKPTSSPTSNPTVIPSKIPSLAPTFIPSEFPTFIQSESLTFIPSESPTSMPSKYPTASPTEHTIVYIVTITISFPFQINSTDTRLLHLLTNASSDLCVGHVNLTYTNNVQSTIATYTILSCDHESQTKLVLRVMDNQQLQKKILQEIGNFTGFNVNISILDNGEPVDVPSSTFITSQASTRASHQWFWVMIGILLALACSCFISISLTIGVYRKLRMQRLPKDVDTMCTDVTQQTITKMEPKRQMSVSLQKVDFNDQLSANMDDTSIPQKVAISSIAQISSHRKTIPAAIHVAGAPVGALRCADDGHENLGNDEIAIVTSGDIPDFIVVSDDESAGYTKVTADIATPEVLASEFRTPTVGAPVDHKTNYEVMQFWIKHTVGLAQYYKLFIEYGYESLDFVKEINSRDHLKEIGINLREHQTKLLSEIARLKLIDDKENINEYMLRQMMKEM